MLSHFHKIQIAFDALDAKSWKRYSQASAPLTISFFQGSWVPGEENLMNNEYYKSMSNSSFNWKQM